MQDKIVHASCDVGVRFWLFGTVCISCLLFVNAACTAAGISVSDPAIGVVNHIVFSGLDKKVGVCSNELMQISLSIRFEGKDCFASPVGKGRKVYLKGLLNQGYLWHASVFKALLDDIVRYYRSRGIVAVRANISRASLNQLKKGGNGVLAIDILVGKVAKIRVIPVGNAQSGQNQQNQSLKGQKTDINNKNPIKSAETSGNQTKVNFNQKKPNKKAAKANKNCVKQTGQNQTKTGVNEKKTGQNRTKTTRKDRLFEHIKACSPIHPGDAVYINELSRYINFLNRYPGRQVDAALAAGRDVSAKEPANMPCKTESKVGRLILNYMVAERKRPLLYSRLTNNGTKETTKWREQFGLVQYNLANMSDTLYLDYLTGNFDSVHSVSGGYEWNLGDMFDADTCGKSKHNSKISNWNFGDLTRVRAGLSGSWRQYDASEVGLGGMKFHGRSYGLGGELTWNFYQRRDWFVDVVAGLQYDRIKVNNELAGVKGSSGFLLPHFGFRLEHNTARGSLNGMTSVMFNLPGLGGTADEGLGALDRLGRVNTDRRWLIWQYSLSGSVFLEPLFDKNWGITDAVRGNNNVVSGNNWAGSSEGGKVKTHFSTLAHELFGRVSGQFVPGDRRLPANYTQTIGGANTVRGYPEAFAAGDNGVYGTLEYRYHWPRSLRPQNNPGRLLGKPFRFRPGYELGVPDWDLVLCGFADAGYVSDNSALSYERDITLVSAGVGAEVSLRNNIKFRADWGWPLKQADNGSEKVTTGHCRVHLALTVVY